MKAACSVLALIILVSLAQGVAAQATPEEDSLPVSCQESDGHAHTHLSTIIDRSCVSEQCLAEFEPVESEQSALAPATEVAEPLPSFASDIPSMKEEDPSPARPKGDPMLFLLQSVVLRV